MMKLRIKHVAKDVAATFKAKAQDWGVRQLQRALDEAGVPTQTDAGGVVHTKRSWARELARPVIRAVLAKIGGRRG